MMRRLPSSANPIPLGRAVRETLAKPFFGGGGGKKNRVVLHRDPNISKNFFSLFFQPIVEYCPEMIDFGVFDRL